MNENYHVAIAFDATGAITACKAQATDEGISDKVNFLSLYGEDIYNAIKSLKYKVNRILYKNKYKFGRNLVDIVFHDKDLLEQTTEFTEHLNSHMELLLSGIGNNSTIYLLELTKDDLIAISTPSFKAQNKHRFYRQLGMCVPDYFVFTMFIVNHIIKKFAKEHGYNIVSVKRKAQAARCFFCGKLHIEDLELPIQNLRKYKNLKSVKEANRKKLIISEKNGISVHISTVEYISLCCYFEQSNKMQDDFRQHIYSTMHITINMLRDIFPDVEFDLTNCFEDNDYSDETVLNDVKDTVLSVKELDNLTSSYTDTSINDSEELKKSEKTKKKKISIMDL